MSDDFYSFYGSGQKTEESKPEAEVKKPSGVQTRKLAPVTVAPSASVPTPTVPDRPLAEPDPRQIDQATLAQQAQTGLTKAGPPQAPSVVNAMADTGKDLLPYAIGAGGAYGLSKLFDMFNKKGGDGGPPPPPGGPTHQDEINRLKLEREQLKNEKAKIEHQNWLAKNTLTEAEQIFGRKAKDATELRLMEKAYEQQKSGVVGATPPPPVPPAPVAPAPAPAAAPSASVAPPAPPVAPPTALAPQPAVVQPANVISTGPTPEAAAAPIEKAEEAKAVTKPTTKKKSEVVTFKSAADVPEGYVFRPDVGNLDRSMYNILGPEHRQQAKEWLTGGKMFGHSADVNADVSKLSTEYFQKLQSEIPETILSRDARRAQNVPSKFGNYGSQGFGKAAKVAGVAGTLFAVADLANAQTPEQKATAGTNLLGAVLPPGMDVLEAGAPTVGKQQIQNAYLLGSPYAQTEEAKKARLKEKAGAGRGIAPPSAYMR